MGEELFVFGGLPEPHSQDQFLAPLKDGALLDPKSGGARAIAESPFDPAPFAPTALTVGDVVIVLGTDCTPVPDEEEGFICDPGTPVAAQYEVGSNSWTKVAVPEELSKFKNGVYLGLGSTSDGQGVFEFLSARDNTQHEYWTYRPSSAEWLQLESPGVIASGSCMAGDLLVVGSTKFENQGRILDHDPQLTPKPGEIYSYGPNDGNVQPSLAILDVKAPKDGWRNSEPEPTVKYPNGSPGVSCMGSRDGQGEAVMLIDRTMGQRNLRLYSLSTESWSAPPPSPSDVFSVNQVWTGNELVFLPAAVDIAKPGVAYDPAQDTWRVVPGAPALDRGALWNGSEIAAYAEPGGVSARDIAIASRKLEGAIAFAP